VRYLRLPLLGGMFVLFCFAVSGFVPPAFSVENDAALEDFLEKVEASSASINSFSCDFTQVRYLTIFPKPVKFTGRLSLVRPDKLRWEFFAPLASVIVLNGQKGLKCSEDGPVRKFGLDQDPVMRMVAAQMWAWTSGSYRELRNDFDFTLFPGPTLVFSPVHQEAAGSFISRIKVVFDPDYLQPIEVEISEPGGDRTVISFSDYRRNLDLKSDLFTECGIR